MSSLNSSVTGMSRAIASRSACGSSSVPDGRVLAVVSLDGVEGEVAVVVAAATEDVVVVVVPELDVQLARTSAIATAKENREITPEIYRHLEENLMLGIAETAEDCIQCPDRVYCLPPQYPRTLGTCRRISPSASNIATS